MMDLFSKHERSVFPLNSYRLSVGIIEVQQGIWIQEERAMTLNVLKNRNYVEFSL